MKFTTTTYGNRTNILAIADHYVAFPVTVDSTDAGVTTDSTTGKKTLAAGTVIGGGFLTSKTAKATTQNDADAEGVLLYDVDVTYGDAAGAAVVHGFISKSKMPTTPDTTAIAALKGITFLA